MREWRPKPNKNGEPLAIVFLCEFLQHNQVVALLELLYQHKDAILEAAQQRDQAQVSPSYEQKPRYHVINDITVPHSAKPVDNDISNSGVATMAEEEGTSNKLKPIDSSERLEEVKGYTSGYLINCNSQVAHGNKHVVHVLPLGPDCGGGRMKLGSYPKYYTADSAGLCRLGTQGERWIFGKCCQERDMTAQSVDDLADN